MSGIAQFLVEGGWWMAPIGFLSIFVVAVIVERFYYLLVVFKEDPHALMSQVKAYVDEDKFDEAMALCEKNPRGPLSRVFREILLTAPGRSVQEVEIAVEEATMEVVPEIQKRSHTLAGFASLATLLGLLGTVMGLIEAFTVVADAPPDQKSVLLTKAISVAMNCTAFGLIVAIPAMFSQLFVSDIVKKILDYVDAFSLKLENILTAKYGGRK